MSDIGDLEYEIEQLKTEKETLQDVIKDLEKRIEKMTDTAYELYQM